ncbi:PilC/PilY family type IV pilus protein [Acinetobacter sichuanensis]|uniref:PilC/PilY family type IV pilus protein n=1 Tax=Acinetobacter sichuanensis TaxID=2136183 RepID=A0A371YV31_9GAMM|nr:PilC/PilY family type IV pilus protein [Acinetobacter sichuanensis]RFC85331.1 pilus assembly protein PilY [Acinetobacter sichuanensis]
MKTLNKNFLNSSRYKVLVISIAAISTMLVSTSVTQASDIDIYQDAKSGDITLMFMLDISGSMGAPQQIGNKSSCDIPNEASIASSDREDSTNGSPSYKRYYCNVADTKTYKYRFRNNTYWKCTNESASISNCNWGASFSKKPSDYDALHKETVRIGGSSYTVAYEGMIRKYYDRITRVKDGMFDLLNGNRANNIPQLADDKIIGLTTYSRPTSFDSEGRPSEADNVRGQVRIPARRLDAVVDGITQRQILLNEIAQLGARGGTPTAHAYAEAVASLWGATTINTNSSGFLYAGTGVTSGNNYIIPESIQKQITGESNQQCSGQGVYVLTDGVPSNNDQAQELMKKVLDNNSFSCTNSSTGWDCINKFSQSILKQALNGNRPILKTAVVGFGSDFNNINSFSKELSTEQNLDNIASANASEDVKNAARWGVQSEGGWYSGNSSQDVVDSVNDFINNLSKEIPSVTTGSPTIPRDALNPAELQDNAYYQTFQPTPATNYQLWLGNLKKYLVSENGVLKAKNAATVFESDGRIKEPVYDANGNITSAIYDFWAKQIDTAVENGDENTIGSKKFAVRGGAWSQMLLGINTENKAERKLLTNRKAVTENGNTSFKGTGTLRQVQLADIVDTTYKNDPNRGYLWSLLGYNIDVVNPPTTIDNLKAQPNLRQMGAVMHSYPLLVTNNGKLEYNKTTKVMESTSREDYVLFGTTQGLLHVVDAETGVEKFAFVPNEMVENQKDAFRLSSVTNGGLQKLYYGIDGSWSLYTQYVVDSSGNLVVGKGRTDSQQGMQMAYGGLRMGGRSYYALDLSNINSPELKFHIDPTTQKVYSGSSSTTFNQLQYMGQSWSKPAIGWVNWGGTRKRVMFVGGGYDAGGDDGDAHTNGMKGLYSGYENANYNPSRSKGAGIYMFDADNGDLLWWASDYATATSPTDVNTGVISTKSADLKYSVVSEIRTVDRDGDDLIDHLYFGDLGGQLFRIDLDNKQNIKGAVPKAPVKIFTMHTDVASPRFYDMPGFSLYNQNGTTFAVISQGSGNRSAPLVSYTSSNTSDEYDAIYNIYDKDVARRDLFNRKTDLNTQNLKKTNLGEITDLNRFENTTLVAPFSEKGGWYYDFKTCTAGVDGKLTNCNNYNKQSEKVFGTPLAMNYKLYVSTFDSSKPGISGECGAGVKGESMLTAFCMPFGQCASKLEPARGVIGIGIHTVTVGGKKGEGGGSEGGEGECVGESCPPVDCKDESCPPKATGNTSATNYCINTSGRIALTVTGGFGNGEATEMCLIPQRWYEKLARKVS